MKVGFGTAKIKCIVLELVFETMPYCGVQIEELNLFFLYKICENAPFGTLRRKFLNKAGQSCGVSGGFAFTNYLGRC